MTEEQAFLDAIELTDSVERAAHLDRVCGRDTALRRQVEELLAAHFRSGKFLDEPVGVQAESGPTPLDGNAAHGYPGLPFLKPTARPDSLGQIGHYEVLEILGRGGFGIVLRAFDEVLHRVVALKVLAPAVAATSPARKRFLREARSSARIRHENVVQVHAVEEQPLPYLVMEFVPGESLQQRLDRTGPLDASEIVRLGRQIAEGLAAAHSTGLVHRDIKPGNVLIECGTQERVKLTDFGLARAADDASLTQSGVLAGTPLYMAPEQAKGESLDHRADLFSLGTVMYVMAAGRPPFRAATTYAVLKRVVEDAPRPVRELIPELPQWLADVIARLHSKKPEDRFQSAREVADVLADCEAGRCANPDLTGIPPIRSRRWPRLATIVLLPVLLAAVCEFSGLTQWLRKPPNDELNANRPEPPKDYSHSLGMKLVPIPAGKFTMGTPPEELQRFLDQFKNEVWIKYRLLSEGPNHDVEITRPFFMGDTEVTVRQFQEYLAANPDAVIDGHWRDPAFTSMTDYPAVWVSWQNAVDFCKWLSRKEGRTYRLPTEAEWEYCCRAGRSGTRFSHGDDDERLASFAWYADTSNRGLHSVAGKQPNDWGLYDLHGNAWEYCQDESDLKYYSDSPRKDPSGGRGPGRVLRGGAWYTPAICCRCAFRHYCHNSDANGDGHAGFRVVLEK